MKTHQIETKSITEAKTALPSKEVLTVITELFKALGDTTRAKILYALRKNTLRVGDISTLIEISESATSHQLSYLKQKHLVKAKRDGTTMFYSMSYKHLSALLKEAEYYADHLRNRLPDHPYDQE